MDQNVLNISRNEMRINPEARGTRKGPAQGIGVGLQGVAVIARKHDHAVGGKGE